MKKLLLSFAALSSLLAANAASPTLNWAYAIDTKYANDQIGGIVLTSDNKTVSYSHFASKDDGDSFSYNEEVIASPLATSSESRNLVVIKHDTDGSKIWAVYSKQGYVDAGTGAVTATSDGGVLVYFKPRASQVSTTEYVAPVLVDANGTEVEVPNVPTLNWTYNSALVKISGDGIIEWVSEFIIDETPFADKPTAAATDGITPNAVAVDGDGNIFVGGNLREAVVFNGEKNSHYILQPRNASSNSTSGGLYIVKLDKDGNYVGRLEASGAATRDQISGLAYADGKIYFAGNVQGAADQVITLGGKSITLENALDGIIYGSFSAADLSVDYLGYVKPTGASDDKHTTQIKAVRAFDGNVYILGLVKGGFTTASSSDAKIATESTNLEGYIIKLSATDGSWVSATTKNEKNGTTVVIGGYFDIFKSGSDIYALRYAMNASYGVALDKFTDNDKWEDAETTYVIKTAGSPTTAAGVAFDGTNVVLSGRGNKDFSFAGSEKTIAPLEGKFGTVIASFKLDSESTGVDNVAAEAATSYSADRNSVIVKASAPVEVNVYTTAGVQVASQKVEAGTTHIALPQGIYLVNDTKVIVG